MWIHTLLLVALNSNYLNYAVAAEAYPVIFIIIIIIDAREEQETIDIYIYDLTALIVCTGTGARL